MFRSDKRRCDLVLKNLTEWAISLRMCKALQKRAMTLLLLLAFFAGALGPLVPHAQAMGGDPCAMMMTTSSAQDGSSSTGMMPVCGENISCIVVAGLPAAFAPTSTDLVWSTVRYWASADALIGLSIPPNPSPPKSRV